MLSLCSMIEALRLGVRIGVYEREPSGFVEIAAFGDPAADKIRVLYSGRCHYDLLS